jgi:hypothetical protein
VVLAVFGGAGGGGPGAKVYWGLGTAGDGSRA